MFIPIFNKDASIFFKEKWLQLREHLEKRKPNSNLQYINKEPGTIMITLKSQGARLFPHWRQCK